jgi:hypothetical protein
MERSPSIRSCNRARTTERGFALAVALIVAVLYFGLIELMFIDAARDLAEARRFRARVVALTLAENGAELAAANLVTSVVNNPPPVTDWQGITTGTMKKNASTGEFEIHGTGEATGVVSQKATVIVRGQVVGGSVQIHNTQHSQ